MDHRVRRIYAAEFAGGVLKVGTTTRAISRMGSLRFEGKNPERFYCGPEAECSMWPERELIGRVMQIRGAQVIEGSREWFRGVAFRPICDLIDEISAQALEMAAAFPAAQPHSNQP